MTLKWNEKKDIIENQLGPVDVKRYARYAFDATVKGASLRHADGSVTELHGTGSGPKNVYAGLFRAATRLGEGQSLVVTTPGGTTFDAVWNKEQMRFDPK
jgi:hypothetical protein